MVPTCASRTDLGFCRRIAPGIRVHLPGDTVNFCTCILSRKGFFKYLTVWEEQEGYIPGCGAICAKRRQTKGLQVHGGLSRRFIKKGETL